MSITDFPNGVASYGVPVLGSGPVFTTGKVWFVDSNTGAAGNEGNSKDRPFATLAQAVAKCTANKNDVVVMLPGHAETIASTVTLVAGMSVIGVGNGKTRPALTGGLTVDMITGAANCRISNVYFPASTTNGIDSRINVAGANLTVDNCLFLCGAYDLETFTVPAGGDDLRVSNCQFVVTANGPDAAIEVEAAGVDGLIVDGCLFNGGSDTNAWDASAINSDAATTNLMIFDNIFLFGAGIDIDAAALGIIARNLFGEGTLGSMLDPGSCMCFENYEADAINESGRLFPTGAAAP